jgi:hypothetical protein
MCVAGKLFNSNYGCQVMRSLKVNRNLVFTKTQLPPLGQDLLSIEVSLLHSDISHSMVLLWTSDKPNTETSTWQHTTLSRDRHPCLRRDSNQQSQKSELPQTHTIDGIITGTGAPCFINVHIFNFFQYLIIASPKCYILLLFVFRIAVHKCSHHVNFPN